MEKSDEAGKVDQDQPNDQWSWRHPKFRDGGCRKTLRSTIIRTNGDHQISTDIQKSTNPQRQSTTDFSLSRRHSNELQKMGEIAVSISSPGIHLPKHTVRSWMRSLPRSLPVESYWQVKDPPGGIQPRHSRWCRPRSPLRSRPAKTNKSNKFQLKPPIKSATRCPLCSLLRRQQRFFRSRLLTATISSTWWSPEQPSKDHYRVNVNYHSL